jgi:hypothetical protein
MRMRVLFGADVNDGTKTLSILVTVLMSLCLSKLFELDTLDQRLLLQNETRIKQHLRNLYGINDGW